MFFLSGRGKLLPVSFARSKKSKEPLSKKSKEPLSKKSKEPLLKKSKEPLLKKSKDMNLNFYKSIHSTFQLSHVASTIGMCYVSFGSFWSKLFLWSLLSSVVMGIYIQHRIANK